MWSIRHGLACHRRRRWRTSGSNLDHLQTPRWFPCRSSNWPSPKRFWPPATKPIHRGPIYGSACPWSHVRTRTDGGCRFPLAGRCGRSWHRSFGATARYWTFGELPFFLRCRSALRLPFTQRTISSSSGVGRCRSRDFNSAILLGRGGGRSHSRWDPLSAESPSSLVQRRPTVATLAASIEQLIQLNAGLTQSVSSLAQRQTQLEKRSDPAAPEVQVPSSVLRRPISASLAIPAVSAGAVAKTLATPPWAQTPAALGLLSSPQFQPPDLLGLQEEKPQQEQHIPSDHLAQAVLAQSSVR